jgi:uncharacterized protein (TIRG00374 family)
VHHATTSRVNGDHGGEVEVVKSRTVARWTYLGLGVALGTLLLWLALRSVDAAGLTAALAATDPLLVLLGLLAVGATIVAKALRWRLLFYPQHRTQRWTVLTSALVIGQTVNFLLPARVGELARAYLAGEAEGQGKLLALGTIVVEKLLDGLTLLLLLALLFVVVPVPDWLRLSGAISGLVLVFLLLAVLLLTGQRRRLLGVMDRLGEALPALERLGLRRRTAALADGLSALQSGGVNVRLLLWTTGIWLLAGLTNYLILLALRIEVPLLAASLVVLVVVHLGMVVPTSPARIGVFHYLCLLALSLLGVEQSVALAYGFVLHGVVVLPVIVAGLLCLWKENLSLYRILAEVDER